MTRVNGHLRMRKRRKENGEQQPFYLMSPNWLKRVDWSLETNLKVGKEKVFFLRVPICLTHFTTCVFVDFWAPVIRRSKKNKRMEQKEKKPLRADVRGFSLTVFYS